MDHIIVFAAPSNDTIRIRKHTFILVLFGFTSETIEEEKKEGAYYE